MEAFEELTPERIRDLTREEAQVLIKERENLLFRLNLEIGLLWEKVRPKSKVKTVQKIVGTMKCPHCGSTDLMPQAGNRVFCRRCNISSLPYLEV